MYCFKKKIHSVQYRGIITMMWNSIFLKKHIRLLIWDFMIFQIQKCQNNNWKNTNTPNKNPNIPSACFGRLYTRIGTMQRLAWPLLRMTHRFVKHSLLFSYARWILYLSKAEKKSPSLNFLLTRLALNELWQWNNPFDMGQLLWP